MIKPTVGRVVWYWPLMGVAINESVDQPFAAIVANVNADNNVNLCAIDHEGHQHPVQNVLLVQDGDDVPTYGGYAEWMPYQKGQAAKAELSDADRQRAAMGKAV